MVDTMEAPTDLAPARSVRLSQGTIRYRDEGAGPPLVFVHGLLVTGGLWRAVVPALVGAGYRCIVPDWPLGSHGEAMRPDADLSPPGLARLIADFLAALALDDVTLVGNDTGGALCQLVATSHPERLGRLVLTDCDAFDNFPPPLLWPLVRGARLPGFVRLFAASLRWRVVQRLLFAFVQKRPLDPAFARECVEPAIVEAGVRRDLGEALRGIDARHTRAAAAALARFTRPSLIVWSVDDRVFPLRDGRRLAATLPNARLRTVSGARAFLSIDRPALLTEHLLAFLRETTPMAA